MSSQALHKKANTKPRVMRLIDNIWIHSMAEESKQKCVEEDLEDEEKTIMYLLTHNTNVGNNCIELDSKEECNEILKSIRQEHQVTDRLPVSAFTKKIPGYCTKRSKAYFNEENYYSSPPGNSFLGSI